MAKFLWTLPRQRNCLIIFVLSSTDVMLHLVIRWCWCSRWCGDGLFRRSWRFYLRIEVAYRDTEWIDAVKWGFLEISNDQRNFHWLFATSFRTRSQNPQACADRFSCLVLIGRCDWCSLVLIGRGLSRLLWRWSLSGFFRVECRWCLSATCTRLDFLVIIECKRI